MMCILSKFSPLLLHNTVMYAKPNSRWLYRLGAGSKMPRSREMITRGNAFHRIEPLTFFSMCKIRCAQEWKSEWMGRKRRGTFGFSLHFTPFCLLACYSWRYLTLCVTKYHANDGGPTRRAHGGTDYYQQRTGHTILSAACGLCNTRSSYWKSGRVAVCC